MEVVQRALSPLVAIKSSPDASYITSRNNLSSITDLLAPFGHRISKKVTTRDSQGQACNIENFTLRFRELDNLSPYQSGILGTALSEPFSSFGDDDNTARKFHLDELKNSGIAASEFESYSPWFSQYRDMICQFNGISEHETFNHPVACIYVVTTSVPDPIAYLTQLSSSDLPNNFDPTTGYLDNNFLKHYVLIHDPNIPGNLVDPEQTFNLMRRTFGLGCSFINLATTSTTSTQEVSSIWIEHLESKNRIHSILNDFNRRESGNNINPLPLSSLPPQLQLTSTDITILDTFVRDFVVLSLLPFMERCVQHWNEQFASSRRGIAGKLFSVSKKYFGGSGNTSPSKGATSPQSGNFVDPQGSLIYMPQSPEMSMRRLADFSFMLRDYRFAYSIYDTLRKDFQNVEKALKYYAGTQEMLGICVLMMDGVGKSTIETYLDTSINSYKALGDFIYETRSTMFFYEMIKHKGQHREASTFLNKMTGEESDLRAALFLEQSALCFLKGGVVMARKYAFFLVLAGSRFGKCNQKRQALRCFTNALKVYQGLDWTLIEDHIFFALGRQSVSMGDLVSGANYFGKLLRESQHQDPAQQAAYLKDFLNLYQQIKLTGNKEEVNKIAPLNLPDITNSIISLSRNPSSIQINSNDESWDKLEQDLMNSYSSKKNISRFPTTTLPLHDPNIVTCAVGEPVFVHLHIKNPLGIPIVLNNISVRCSFGDQVEGGVGEDKDREHLILIEYEGFTVENIPDFSLGAGGEAKITLTIIPKIEGRIHILGAIYLINHHILVFIPLTKNVNSKPVIPRLNVTPPMPILEVLFHGVPDSLASGEIVRVVMQVNNKGNRGLTNLRVKLSHFPFFYFGEVGDMDRDAYVFGNDGRSSETISLKNNLSDLSIVDIKLPKSLASSFAVLPPGETTLLPLFLRGDRMGKHSFKFVFGYQAEANTDTRRLKCSINTTVQPSLRINAFTRPSIRSLNEFILGVEVENLQSKTCVNINQVSASSSKWTIEPIQGSHPSDFGLEIDPRQTLYMYFRFTRIIRKNTDVSSLPESYVTKAIEKTILTEGTDVINPPNLEMIVSNIKMRDSIIAPTDMLLREFSLRSRTQWRFNSLSNMYPGLSSEKLSSLFTLYFSDDVDLSLFWSMPNADGVVERKGHQYIMGINLSLQSPLYELQRKFGGKNADSITSKALYQATVREKKILVSTLLKTRMKETSPLRVVLESDNHYAHDFSEGDCTISTSIRLNNSSPYNSASFSLELTSTDDFQWWGKLFFHGKIEPEQETCISVQAYFFRPGVYDLNRWKLSVELGKDDEGKSAFVQTPNLPHYVTII